MIIYEIILYNDGKIAKLLLKGELLIVLLLFIGSSISLDIIYWQTDLVDILMSFLLWFFYLIALFSYKSLIKAKRKVDKLNQELALSDEENKRLLLANERNRIAGEIHDNLGHNLVALNMHLDGLKHMLGTDNKQIAAIISKTQTITKNSLTDLRKVVYALKDDDNENITTTIKKIIANIESLNTVKVFLNINEAVNELMEIKDLICSIIKESLTNSIKHGLASLVYLDIIVNNEQLTILIKDNGVGCKKIVKGNGLKGIDLKVTNRGGKVEYQTASSGFETKVIIPKIGDDYCENSLGIS
jgi:signal transduction histidine kinase